MKKLFVFSSLISKTSLSMMIAAQLSAGSNLGYAQTVFKGVPEPALDKVAQCESADRLAARYIRYYLKVQEKKKSLKDVMISAAGYPLGLAGAYKGAKLMAQGTAELSAGFQMAQANAKKYKEIFDQMRVNQLMELEEEIFSSSSRVYHRSSVTNLKYDKLAKEFVEDLATSMPDEISVVSAKQRRLAAEAGEEIGGKIDTNAAKMADTQMRKARKASRLLKLNGTGRLMSGLSLFGLGFFLIEETFSVTAQPVTTEELSDSKKVIADALFNPQKFCTYEKRYASNTRNPYKDRVDFLIKELDQKELDMTQMVAELSTVYQGPGIKHFIEPEHQASESVGISKVTPTARQAESK